MRQGETPKIIDAEFEVVSGLDRKDHYEEPRRRFEVVWPLSRFVWFCLVGVAIFGFLWFVAAAQKTEADRACVLIYESTKTHADISVPDFCRSRLIHQDGYQPR